jgi:hypothetical protein
VRKGCVGAWGGAVVMRTIAAARSRPIGLGDRAGRDEQRPVPVAFPRHGGRQRGATHPASSGRGGGISEIIKGGCAEYKLIKVHPGEAYRP